MQNDHTLHLRRLFVGGIPKNYDNASLNRLLGKFGSVECTVPVSKKAKKKKNQGTAENTGRGYGFAVFAYIQVS